MSLFEDFCRDFCMLILEENEFECKILDNYGYCPVSKFVKWLKNRLDDTK